MFLPLLVMGLIAVARASTGLVAPLTGVLMRLKSLGFVGKLGYGFSLGLWTLFCLPTTPIELAAGYIFPMVPSAFISAVGKTAGNLAALVLGRRLLRPLLQRWLSRSDSSTLHEHLLRELRENPIQTSAPLPPALTPTLCHDSWTFRVHVCLYSEHHACGASSDPLQNLRAQPFPSGVGPFLYVCGNRPHVQFALVARMEPHRLVCQHSA